jgi:hypothetical protein
MHSQTEKANNIVLILKYFNIIGFMKIKCFYIKNTMKNKNKFMSIWS